MIVVLYFMISNIAIYYYASKLVAQPRADTLIVLGARITDNSSQPGHSLRERLDLATDYLVKNPLTNVIVCGGILHGESASEASVMRTYLLTKGIASDRIYIEDQSTRTAHQFIYPKKMMKLGSVVVVTSDFHMLRSMMLAKRSGVENISALVATSHYDNPDKFIALWREPLALANSFLFDHPK